MAMLQHGAAAIKVKQSFLGVLGRIEGSHVVLEAVVELNDETRSNSLLTIGIRTPMDDTIIGTALDTAGTQSWDDLQAVEGLPRRARTQGRLAVIVTMFYAGGSSYVLAFGSMEPATKPFNVQDRAYVEILGSFFCYPPPRAVAVNSNQLPTRARLGDRSLEPKSIPIAWP